MAKLKTVGYGHRGGGFLWKIRRLYHGSIYIASTMWAWLFQGRKVRREYRECIAHKRTYYVDRMFEEDT